MKKLLALSLLAIILLSLAACGAEKPAGPAETQAAETTMAAETTEETTAGPTEVLPDVDYGGYEIRMFMRCVDVNYNWIADMYAEELNGDVLNDAVYKRNLKVSERLGVNFKVIPSEAADSNGGTGATKTILAGEDAYDIVVPHARNSIDSYGFKGLAYNWLTDLPWVDLSQPWWSQDAIENLSIGGNLYSMVGDISYMCTGACNVMLFNKKLLDDIGADYPYESVLEGSWTFDSFGQIARDGAYDLDGDGKMVYTADRFGYSTYQWIGPIQVLYSGGGRIMELDADGVPKITLNNERNVNSYAWFFELLDSDCSYMPLHSGGDYDIRNIDMFREGRVVFADMNLKMLAKIRDMEDDSGILPWPKYDEAMEKYIANVDAGTNMFVVPVTVKDPEMVSAVLEALAAEGSRTVIPAYYEVTLQVKFARDNVSAQMLDIIREGGVFDTGYYITTLGGQMSSFGYRLAGDASHNFASLYASQEKAVLANIEKVMADLQ